MLWGPEEVLEHHTRRFDEVTVDTSAVEARVPSPRQHAMQPMTKFVEKLPDVVVSQQARLSRRWSSEIQYYCREWIVSSSVFLGVTLAEY